MFYIYMLDQVLTYKVDQITVIDPSETEPLRLQDGQDYVTLVTCTPYAVNTHRLLVRGTRIVEEESVEKVETKKKTTKTDLLLYLGIGIGIIVFIITIIFTIKMKKKKQC